LKNVALGKEACQSSTYSKFVASKAVDGQIGGSMHGATHTKGELGQWWQVDLGKVYEIEKIVLNNTTDACCVDRLNDFTISTSTKEFRGNRDKNAKTWARERGKMGARKEYTGKRYARYVRVWLNGEDTKRFIQLTEVEVYGK